MGWFADAQGLDNLLPYLKRSLEIASGYIDALGLDESAAVFALAVSSLVISGIFIFQVWFKLEERAFAWGSAAFLAAIWFLVWKEAIVRGDDHVFALFFFTMIAAVTLPTLFFPATRVSWFEGVLLVCIAGSVQVSPVHFWGVIKFAPGRLVKGASTMTQIMSVPAKWEQEFREAAVASGLPKIKKAVGTGTVDVIDYRQSAALLNGLNYTPRPVIQSYTAYTPGLAGCNLRFYQSPQQPDFILWNSDRIDNRFPTLDDNFLWESWYGHYTPSVHEGDYWLLKKSSDKPLELPVRSPLLERTLKLGETLTLPKESSSPLGALVEVNESLGGRVRSIVYKPALINLVTTEADGIKRSWRFIPSIAKGGFLLSPFAVTDREFVSLFRGAGSRWVKSITFDAPDGERRFWNSVTVHIYQLPQLSLGSPLSGWVEEGIVASTPRDMTAKAPPEFFTINGQRVVQLHAPGMLVLSIPVGARRFTGDFGLREGAYSGDGHTDGVEFFHRNYERTNDTGRDLGPLP